MANMQTRKDMDYIIREIRKNESLLLNDFLYEAIYVPEGKPIPPKSVINLPELQVYRVMNDYGHIEDGVPSFAISLFKEYRGYGIGTAMMKKMICELKQRGYEKASLSVQKANYAVKMYKDVGFEIIAEKEEEYVMVCQLED